MPQSYGRIVFVLLGVGLAVYLCWKITQRVDAFLYPWADERSGKPVLTGAWVGHTKNTDGGSLGVMIELRRWRPEHASDCSSCNTLQGRAVTCNEAGAHLNYRVSGKPADRRATRFSLGAKPVDDVPADEVELGAVRGTWQAGALNLEVDFHSRATLSASGGRAAAASDSALHLAMKRGAENAFQLLCERISRGTSQ